MHIGIAGTGKMGAAMAVRLQSLGHQVTVWNRTRQRAQSLLDAGIGWADTPQALADATEVVISIVTHAQALDDVYSSAQGLFSARQPADVRAVGEVDEAGDGLRYALEIAGVRQSIRMAFAGRHNVINALAAAGVRCTNGYVTGPYCSPTRAGLLTGRQQNRFGHEFNPGGGHGLPLTETILPQRLAAAGHRVFRRFSR